MLFKRFFGSQPAAARHHRHRWAVKQVTKPNFSEALAEIKTCITNSDYIAVSLQKTGGHSAPWQKPLPIDTAETAYIKAKYAATRFQILQFSVCPFSVEASKITAHPYNFHLFPRDELKVGMPSYCFSCQSSYLTAMAREGFDFNACINDGISYLSRAQESAAKAPIGHLTSCSIMGSSVNSVADSLFTERVKSRVKNWIKACKDSNRTENALLTTLRRLVSGHEVYGSRPSLTIDVCSERQVQLALEGVIDTFGRIKYGRMSSLFLYQALKEYVDVVPLQFPLKVKGVQTVRVVLTSSEEDRNILEKEIEDKVHEKRELVLGFREVIDLISASQKPVVAHNSLNDFAFIHSKFLAPLPITTDEFTSSLLSVFPHILDVNHLMKEIGAFEKMNSISGAISYLESRFSAPINMEISNRAETDKVDVHGHNVLRVCQLFVKLCSILKISLEVPEDYDADDVRIWTGNSKLIGVGKLVILWGFKSGISARDLKDLLRDSHDVFSEEFDVRLIDRTCAVVVFWTPGFSERFLRMMGSGDNLSGEMKDRILEGLRASGYKTYRRVCESGLWKSDLAECLDQAMDENGVLSGAESGQERSVIYWNDDEMINLDDF
ncbi:hypothetical protein OROGR_002459 [Orobanche gracilis]